MFGDLDWFVDLDFFDSFSGVSFVLSLDRLLLVLGVVVLLLLVLIVLTFFSSLCKDFFFLEVNVGVATMASFRSFVVTLSFLVLFSLDEGVFVFGFVVVVVSSIRSLTFGEPNDCRFDLLFFVFLVSLLGFSFLSVKVVVVVVAVVVVAVVVVDLGVLGDVVVVVVFFFVAIVDDREDEVMFRLN